MVGNYFASMGRGFAPEGERDTAMQQALLQFGAGMLANPTGNFARNVGTAISPALDRFNERQNLDSVTAAREQQSALDRARLALSLRKLQGETQDQALEQSKARMSMLAKAREQAALSGKDVRPLNDAYQMAMRDHFKLQGGSIPDALRTPTAREQVRDDVLSAQSMAGGPQGPTRRAATMMGDVRRDVPRLTLGQFAGNPEAQARFLAAQGVDAPTIQSTLKGAELNMGKAVAPGSIMQYPDGSARHTVDPGRAVNMGPDGQLVINRALLGARMAEDNNRVVTEAAANAGVRPLTVIGPDGEQRTTTMGAAGLVSAPPSVSSILNGAQAASREAAQRIKSMQAGPSGTSGGVQTGLSPATQSGNQQRNDEAKRTGDAFAAQDEKISGISGQLDASGMLYDMLQTGTLRTGALQPLATTLANYGEALFGTDFGLANLPAQGMADSMIMKRVFDVLAQQKGVQTEGDAQRAMATGEMLTRPADANKFIAAYTLVTLERKRAALLGARAAYDYDLQNNTSGATMSYRGYLDKAERYMRNKSIWDDERLAPFRGLTQQDKDGRWTAR